jgi:hypothetical protein
VGDLRDLRLGRTGPADHEAVLDRHSAAGADALTDFAERTGESPTDPDVKQRYCLSVPGSATIAWPPERNAACWCGSARKYKKCCGRAT